MLENILRLIGTGQAWSVDDLSKELGSTKESILAAIEFLEQTKYIKRVKLCNCTGQCGNCHACDGMELLSTQPFMWEIVKKV